MLKTLEQNNAILPKRLASLHKLCGSPVFKQFVELYSLEANSLYHAKKLKIDKEQTPNPLELEINKQLAPFI
ncbi:hypothetical protein [Helicobacter suis]|uniref:hypothetical protein n=1 Tax=Helicobacter suis TaxID=104628 RepID=UPI0013D6C383|nr:hypothetical protein [Helicobacter suis]